MTGTQRQHENTFNLELFAHTALFLYAHLYFNNLGLIKSVHQVFIFKNISHLIADYTGAANHSVNVGVRMPVNPGVDPAVGNQVFAFTGKGAVQRGTYMIRSHYLKCRQMMCNHDNMGRSALFNAFPDKTNTSLVHPVEVIHLKQLPVELYLAEVIHAFPHEIPAVLVNTNLLFIFLAVKLIHNSCILQSFCYLREKH